MIVSITVTSSIQTSDNKPKPPIIRGRVNPFFCAHRDWDEIPF